MSFSIPITHLIKEINLEEGVFIFIHRASKVPPHIGMIINGLLFEISTSGPGYQQKGIDLLKTAQKRGTEVVFIELENPHSNTQEGSLPLRGVGGVINEKELEQVMIQLVKHYHSVSNEVSCLNPVKDFIESKYQIEVKSARFIFELLPVLYLNHLVKASFEVNLTHKLIEGQFTLKTYSKEDVNQCIAAVNRKNKSEINS
jgi:hypothetical protein